MAKKCCPSKIILIIVLILVIVGGIYWWKTNQEPQEVTEEATEETPDTYALSDDLKEALEDMENELSMSLFRGDAELAPTYEEFMTNVNTAQDKLQAVIDDFRTESEGKEVPEEISTIFTDFEKVNDDLSMSLMRGDAELAPTYEEFSETVRGIDEEFDTYMEVYRAL